MSHTPGAQPPRSPWESPGYTPRPDSPPPAQEDPAGGYGYQGTPYPPQGGYQPPQGGHQPPQDPGRGVYTFPTLEKKPLEVLAPASVLTSPICPLGLGIGIVALQRIGRTGRRGRGIAITGILLSSLFLAAAVLTLGTFALDGTFARMAEKPQAGDFTSTRTISPINLDVGNCVLTLPVTGEVGEVTGTPCAEEHQVQVTARVPIPDADRPSEEALFTRAEQTCREVFDGLSPNTASWPQSFSPWWLIPSEANWEAGDRNIICLARSTAGPITEDVVGE